jgi:hypothetical protein
MLYGYMNHITTVPIPLTFFQLKIKILLIISISVLAIFTVLEGKTLWVNGSLILMNMTHDKSWYAWESDWVTRYNEAIWLSQDGQYKEAKLLIAPLLNDTTIPRKAEIAEFYGDLIYSTSGSTGDTIRMYERSLTFAPNERVDAKIAYIKKLVDTKTGSWNIEKTITSTGNTESGSIEREAKKEELKKIATQRSEYLWNNIMSASDSRSALEHLVESAQSGSIDIVQDW